MGKRLRLGTFLLVPTTVHTIIVLVPDHGKEGPPLLHPSIHPSSAILPVRKKGKKQYAKGKIIHSGFLCALRTDGAKRGCMCNVITVTDLISQISDKGVLLIVNALAAMQKPHDKMTKLPILSARLAAPSSLARRAKHRRRGAGVRLVHLRSQHRRVRSCTVRYRNYTPLTCA